MYNKDYFESLVAYLFSTHPALKIKCILIVFYIRLKIISFGTVNILLVQQVVNILLPAIKTQRISINLECKQLKKKKRRPINIVYNIYKRLFSILIKICFQIEYKLVS